MKTMIVTGGGSGLGKELGSLLANEGYLLLLTGRNLKKLEKAKKEIESSGGKADFVQLDLREPSRIGSIIDEIFKKFDVEGIINNAGIGYFGPFPEISEKQIAEMIETNLLGTIYLTKAALPYFTQKGTGHFINIISTAGLRGKVNEAVYCASKFALRGFTESLQKEYEDTGIRFTSVYMGGMDTPFWENSDHISDLSRLRSPREIAEIILANKEQSEIIIENKKS